MSKPRTGSIFTQDILQDVTRAMEMHDISEDQADDVFKRKIRALQKFLQHGMSRFSVETLQHVLSSLAESDSNEMDAKLSISSLKEVRSIVKMAIMKRESGSFRTSDVDSLHYMELFFYCVYCMSEAKRLFELLYEDLFYSYYDPEDVISRQNTRTMSAYRNSDTSKRVDGLTEAEHYSQFGISTLDLMTGSTQHKLKQTVQDMKMVLNRWTELLTENDLNPESFDPESEQDLIRLHGASGIEPVLRLVPDMFAKYYKCLELAKQWWVIAHEIYTGLPFQRRPPMADDSDKNSFGVSSVTLQDMSTDDDNESFRLDDDETESDEVSNTLELIQTLNGEIEVLEKREEKFEVLTETYNKVGNDIEHLQAKRNKLLIEQESIKAKGIHKEIESIEAQLNSNSSSIKLLEFQHALLFEDYVIHLELRPSIIRFLHDAKIQLNEAQNTLTATRARNDNEQTIEHNVSNHNNETFDNRHENSNMSHKYQSEYSLQSIERGVKAVSDKCIELEQENTIMRARKLSLSKLNKRHSERSLLKKTDEDNNKINSSKPPSIKPDYNNNGSMKGAKPVAKSHKSEATKPELKVIRENDKKVVSPGDDHAQNGNISNNKRRSVSEPHGVKKVDNQKHGSTKSDTSSNKEKPQGSLQKNSGDKSSGIKRVEERKEQIQKPKLTAKHTEQSDKNSKHNYDSITNDTKTTKEQNGTILKNKNPQRRRSSDSKGLPGGQIKSVSGKDNETKPKAGPHPPMSTHLDQKRARAK